MQSHGSGCFKGNRLGADLIRGSWLFGLTALVSGVDTKLCTIPASLQAPALFKARVIVGTASDAATTDVVRLGTTAGGVDVLADSNVKAAANTNYTGTNDFTLVRADTTIFIRLTTTGAKTAGDFVVVIEPFDVNVAALSTQET